jgi:hypothetical protein
MLFRMGSVMEREVGLSKFGGRVREHNEETIHFSQSGCFYTDCISTQRSVHNTFILC